MVIQLTALAGSLQGLFTTAAQRLGRLTGWMQRHSKLQPAQFVQTLVFGWMAKPKTTLEALARKLKISPEGLRQRLGPKAQEFLRRLLCEALHNAWQARAERLGLLDRFTAAIVEDTTVIALPADLADVFPGCGGRREEDGAASLKVLIRWDVRTGELQQLTVHAGRVSDKALAAGSADIPPGGLHLADQGFFDSERWRQFGSEKYWISRVPAGTRVCWAGVWQALSTLLATVQGLVFDGAVGLVQKTQLPCRLVALRCPEEVANRRRQKLRQYTRQKKGREPSAEQLQMCDWTVLASNVPVEKLSAKEVWLVYRCRWQIELLFKRAKQLAGWGFSWGKTGARVLTELYAKLLGLVVMHWTTLLRGGPLCGISAMKLLVVVQEFAELLRASLAEGATKLEQMLAKLQEEQVRVRPQNKSRKKPSTRQTLLQPSAAA